MASQTSIDLRRLFGLRNGLLEYVQMHAVGEFASKRLDFERFCDFWLLVDPQKSLPKAHTRARVRGGYEAVSKLL